MIKTQDMLYTFEQVECFIRLQLVIPLFLCPQNYKTLRFPGATELFDLGYKGRVFAGYGGI